MLGRTKHKASARWAVGACSNDIPRARYWSCPGYRASIIHLSAGGWQGGTTRGSVYKSVEIVGGAET